MTGLYKNKNDLLRHPEIKGYQKVKKQPRPSQMFKKGPDYSKMNLAEIAAEIDRLKTIIYTKPVPEYLGFSSTQVRALRELTDLREYLWTLLQGGLQQEI